MTNQRWSQSPVLPQPFPADTEVAVFRPGVTNARVLLSDLLQQLGDDATKLVIGNAPPTGADGNDGDIFYDETNIVIYGEKSGGVWPAGTSLVGPQGQDGADGPQGIPGQDGADGAPGPLLIPSFQCRNTDTTTNINNAGLAFVPTTGNVTEAGPAGLFTVVNANQVQITQAARILVLWAVSYQTAVARVNVIIDVAIGNQTQGVRGRGGYVRNANGNNEGTSQAHEILTVAANDLIGIVSQREGAAGTATQLSNAPFGGESVMTIIVLELL